MHWLPPILSKWFRVDSAAPDVREQVCSVPADPPRACHADVAARDAELSGWFRGDTGELFRGVPIGPGDHVVDVGCGDGRNLLFCARQGARVSAVDIDPAVVADIALRLAEVAPADRVATHVSGSNPLPLPDGCASRVVCTEVLEHVDDPDQLLSELARIGAPGALYLLSVPGELQENLQKVVAPPLYFEKPNHIRIISRDAFAAMVTKAGLEIREQAQFGFFWSIWMAFFWDCDVDLNDANHPLIEQWKRTWQAVLDLPKGEKLKRQLDSFMPKTEVIVAWKKP